MDKIIRSKLVRKALALVLALQAGLAQFSGALVRRPNVSVYFALVLALIWYQTGRKEKAA